MLTNFLPLSQAYIHFRINSFHKILDCWGKPQDKLGIIIWDLILLTIASPCCPAACNSRPQPDIRLALTH